MLIFNNSGIWCVTECSDFVDTRSSGKGCQTGKWCIEDKEERNQTPTSHSWDSMCIISSPSDGSQAGLLFSFWLLTWRGHCVYCNSTTQKGKATSVINVICNHLMKLSFKCIALTYQFTRFMKSALCIIAYVKGAVVSEVFSTHVT